MSERNLEFTNEEVYHIYNRGVDGRNITEEVSDSLRFLDCIREFNRIDPIGSFYALSFEQSKLKKNPHSKKPLVRIIAYCLNPNHFHFILEQLVDRGIEKFLHKVCTSYAMYFNHKYKRKGALFQGKFKAKYIGDDDYLLHTSAYVNLNDQVHQLRGKASKLVRNSWEQYTVGKPGLAYPEAVLQQFRSRSEYKQFALDSLELMLETKDEARELKLSDIEFA